jgi:hypothetical protein
VKQQIEGFLEETGADEIIATAQIYDHAARLHSFELAAQVFREINEGQKAMSTPMSVPAAPALG